MGDPLGSPRAVWPKADNIVIRARGGCYKCREGSRSHKNSAVKRARAGVVPGWVTPWEVLVPSGPKRTILSSTRMGGSPCAEWPKADNIVIRARGGCYTNLDRIPTACALLKRGIQLDSPICTYCGTAKEDASHVILRCPMAMQVWDWVFRWCDIPNVQFASMEELLKFSS
uniref:Reverse transcriptase zinc-binding domain-containing protein n=1 Tax=Lactuca sativa TaxID=4236 RepID=A0A9R1WC80_LACSA|nr:hypothetical protein LSAT_V11C200069600 [Lactuca sativa]